MTQRPVESNALTPETFAILERLAGATLGRSARELSDAVLTHATPRLNHLARCGFARVDTHSQLWMITHEGWDHFEAREPERAAGLLPIWAAAERCTQDVPRAALSPDPSGETDNASGD